MIKAILDFTKGGLVAPFRLLLKVLPNIISFERKDCHFQRYIKNHIKNNKGLQDVPSVRSFSGSNAGKYGPEKLRIRTIFTQ